MKTGRPKIYVPFQSIDILIELLSITLLLLMWIYLILEYQSLPEVIASHFNANGKADGFSNKLTLWLLPIISTIIYIGLFILNKFPHIHNYMVNITEDNALNNYRFSTKVLRITNFLSALLFTYLVYSEIQFSKGKIESLGSWFLPIVIGVSIILPIILIVYQRKINKL